jgi:hypothetical protein
MPPDYSSLPALSTRDQDLIKSWIIMGAIDENGVVQSAVPIPTLQYTRNSFLNAVQIVSAASVSSAATGTAVMVVDTGTSKLTGTVIISNMTNTVTTVNIYDGDADNNGALVVALTSTGGGIWTVPPASAALTALQMNRFIAAGIYISVNTAANPNGEIRGQLQNFTANIQLIFNARCVKCHNSSSASLVGLLQGQAYDTLVNQLATQSTGTRVIPFDAADSVLYRRLAGIGLAQMPLDGPPYLPLRGINIIKTWINMGARND